MLLKKCASDIPELRKKGRRGKKRLPTDVGEHAGKKARTNLPELPNSTFMVKIRWVSNGNYNIISPKQLQASYTDVRQREELIDFIDKNGVRKVPYILTSMFKRALVQDKLDTEYMGLYTHGQMMNDPIYGQISYIGKSANQL